MKKSLFNQVVDWTQAWEMSRRQSPAVSCIIAAIARIIHQLTCCIVSDSVSTMSFLQSLYAWTTSLDFSKALLVFACLISSTNQELNILVPQGMSNVLTNQKTPLSIRLLISFRCDSVNSREWQQKTSISVLNSLSSVLYRNTKISAMFQLV